MAVLTEDDIIQVNSGTNAAATNHSVSLSTGTTAGNSVVVAIFCVGTGFTGPTGFIGDATGVTQVGFHRKPPDQLTAGETSWTFTTVGAVDSVWVAWEIANLDPVEPMEVSASGGGTNVANGGTLSTGTTTRAQGLSTLSLAAFVGGKVSGETVSWSSYTNGYQEAVDQGGGATIHGMAVAQLFQSGATNTYSSTATLVRSGASTTCWSRVVVYRAADAPVAYPLYNFTGFEWGTHAGMGTTTSTYGDNPGQPATSQQPGGTWGTTYQIGSSFGRNGGYGMRFTLSAATGWMPMLAAPSNTRASTRGINLRVISGSGQVVLVTGVGGDILYDFSTNKFGVRVVATATIQWESGTTATNTWRWIETRLRRDINPGHLEWRIETGTDTYTDQTAPPDFAAAATTLLQLLPGSTASQTVTFDVDDPVVSKYYSAWPVGAHKVVPLTVDPAGTPTVSGTSGNFSVFTANGTLGAWNAANARNALDEVPPTISASSDGVVQTATAASDYMEFPMDTYTCASDEVIAGVRMVASMWGGTGTGTGTLGIRGWDGTNETVLVSNAAAYDADSLTAASATYPVWRAAFWPAPDGGWTQTKLNALALRVGYSTDATPDMGVSAIYLEVAVKKLTPVRQITVEDPISATADIYVNPDSSASVSYLITNNDATRSVKFNYSISGTPQTLAPVGPSSNQTVQVNADNFGDVSDLSLEPQ